MTHKIMRYTLVGLELFVTIMAIYGSVSLLVDASGFGVQESWLRGSPFSNYQIPALGLLIGVGGSAFLAAVAVLRARPSLGDALTVLAGVILMVFEIVETYSFGLRNFQQPLMFVIGAILVLIAAYLWRTDRPGQAQAGRVTYAR